MIASAILTNLNKLYELLPAALPERSSRHVCRLRPVSEIIIGRNTSC